MKYTLFAAAFCLLFASIVLAQTGEINIIPKPLSIEKAAGSFTLTPQTKIFIPSDIHRRNGQILNDFLQSRYGFKLQITKKYQKRNSKAQNSASIVL